MKHTLPYFVIVGLLCLILFRPEQKVVKAIVVTRDTVFSTDTVRPLIPVASNETVVRYLPYPAISQSDTVRDTVFVYVPITQKVYRDSLYTAWVSGYAAKLDSIELYNRMQTIYVHDKAKRKRLSIGLQAGYGFPHGVYAGIGISCNLFDL